MAGPGQHRTTHSIDVTAPADVVFGLLADAPSWPRYLPPNIHVQRLEFDGRSERLRMWATANGQVKSWTSRREHDPAALRIDFRQEVSAAPVASMGGAWVARPSGATSCRLILDHDFSVVDDRPEHRDWVARAVDRNSRAELDNIRRLAEGHARLAELTVDVVDTVHADGPAEAAYEFLCRVDLWPERLPHVSHVDLTEDGPGVQVVRMRRRAGDGSVQTSESVRVCLPDAGRIVYKQLTPPAPMSVHTGEWTVRAAARGAEISARHTVILCDPASGEAPGEGTAPRTDLGAARAIVARTLSRDSTATLALARTFAESPARRA